MYWPRLLKVASVVTVAWATVVAPRTTHVPPIVIAETATATARTNGRRPRTKARIESTLPFGNRCPATQSPTGGESRPALTICTRAKRTKCDPSDRAIRGERIGYRTDMEK